MKKKIIMFLAAAIMAFNVVLPTLIYAQDVETFTINSSSISKNNPMIGETITFNFDLSNVDNVKKMYVTYGSKNNHPYNTNSFLVEFDVTGEKLTANYTMPLTSNVMPDEYNVMAIYYSTKDNQTIFIDNEDVNKFRDSLKVNLLNDPKRDIIPPEVKSITVNKTTVEAGEELTFDVKTTDNMSGTKSISFHWELENGDRQYINAYIETTKNEFQGKCIIPKNTQAGNWIFKSYNVNDNDLGYASVYNTDKNLPFDFSTLNLNVTNSGGTSIDKDAPVIKSIKIDKSEINIPGIVKYKLEIEDVSKVNSVIISYKNSNNVSVYPRKNETTGLYEGILTLNDDNKYLGQLLELKEIRVADVNGNEAFYVYDVDSVKDQYWNVKPENLRKLNTNIDIKFLNGINDKSSPQLKSFEFNKTEVKTPGVATLNIEAEDKESGLGTVVAYLYEEGKNYTNDSETKVYLNDIYDNRNKWMVNFDFSRYDKSKKLYINKIEITDKVGNKSIYAINPTGNEIKIDKKVLTVTTDETNLVYLSTRTPDLLQQLQNLPEGTTVVIDNSTDSIIKKEVFDTIKGKDIKLVFEKVFGNKWNSQGIQWIINGKDIENETKDIDTNVKLSQESIWPLIYSEDTPMLAGGGGGFLEASVGIYNKAKDEYVYLDVKLDKEYTEEEYMDIPYEERVKMNKELSERLNNKIIEYYVNNGFGYIIDDVKKIQEGLKPVINDGFDSTFQNAFFKLVDQYYLAINFPENGKLPAKSLIRIKLDYATKNLWGLKDLSVYYYNPVTGKNEIIQDNININAEGYYEFSIDHNSEYRMLPMGILNKNIPNNENPPNNESSTNIENPHTNDSMPLIILVLAIISIFGITYSAVKLKKKRDN